MVGPNQKKVLVEIPLEQQAKGPANLTKVEQGTWLYHQQVVYSSYYQMESVTEASSAKAKT